MTRTQFKEKIQTLLNEGDGINQVIVNACMVAVSSKYAENQFLNAAPDNFILPKQVLTAVFEELAFQYEPINGPDKKLVKQLKPLVKIQ